MARIAGVDIPNDKRVVISLTYVYGIGLATSKKILAAAGISEDVRVRDLTSDQEDAIRRLFVPSYNSNWNSPSTKARPVNSFVNSSVADVAVGAGSL